MRAFVNVRMCACAYATYDIRVKYMYNKSDYVSNMYMYNMYMFMYFRL